MITRKEIIESKESSIGRQRYINNYISKDGLGRMDQRAKQRMAGEDSNLPVVETARIDDRHYSWPEGELITSNKIELRRSS